MDYDFRKMGKIIHDLRTSRGWSQEVLSGLAGIGRSHLAMIETGRKNASVETIWRIAAAFGIALSELLKIYESDSF